MRRGIAAASIAALYLFSFNAAVADAPATRFVSLKTAGANGRHGPGLEHRIDWIYQRPGLPLQITGESGPWRRVRDPDGGEVWMHAQNLGERRTVYVTEPAALRRAARSAAPVAAHLSPGVIGALTGCEGEWRRVAVRGRVGWIQAGALWGAGDCAVD